MKDRKAWWRRLPAVTVAVAVIVLLVAAFTSRPTLGAFTAHVASEGNVAGSGTWVGLLETMQETSTNHNGTYLFQLGGGDGTVLGNERQTNLASGAVLDILTTPPAGYNDGGNAELMVDTPWPLDENAALRFSKENPGDERFYVPDGLLQGLINGLVFGYPDEFSQEVWFRTSSSGVVFAYTREGLGISPISSYRLDVTPAGALEFSVRDPGGLLTPPRVDSIVSPQVVADGQWHQAVTTFDHADNMMQLYVDGELVSSKTSSVRPYVPALIPGLVGNLLGVWNYQYGYDGNVRGYNSGLGDARARQFAGDIAFVAGYAEVLPADVIKNHATVGLL